MSLMHLSPLNRNPARDPIRGPNREGAEEVNPFLAELPAATRTVCRCIVCGFTEVFTDEVVDRGWVLLAECPHCDHRWTETCPAPLGISAPAPRATPAPAQVPTRPLRRASEAA